MRLTLLPTTRQGIWSIVLALGVFLFMFVIRTLFMRLFHGMGNESFFSNPYAAISAILAGLSGLGALVVGIFAVAKKNERSLLVGVTILFGLFVVVFGMGELVSPH